MQTPRPNITSSKLVGERDENVEFLTVFAATIKWEFLTTAINSGDESFCWNSTIFLAQNWTISFKNLINFLWKLKWKWSKRIFRLFLLIIGLRYQWIEFYKTVFDEKLIALPLAWNEMENSKLNSFKIKASASSITQAVDEC